MTEAVTLLQELAALDVRLTVQDGRLNADAPRGTITLDLAARIKAQKRQLLDALLSEPERAPTPDPFELGRQPGHCGSCAHWTHDGLGDYLGLCRLGWKAHGFPHQPGPVMSTVHSPCSAHDGAAWKPRKEHP